MYANGTARRLRLAAGLSLEDVGGSIGVSRSTLAKWERGEVAPRAQAGLRAATLLGGLVGALGGVLTEDES